MELGYLNNKRMKLVKNLVQIYREKLEAEKLATDIFGPLWEP
jgi:hypothetical protein